jgi:hypothetical protein
MRMGAHVDRHVIERDVDIGAVIEIEATQEILVGLALSTVLRGDQSRHDLEHFTYSSSRLLLDLFAGDNSLRCRVRREERLRGHAHFRQCHQLSSAPWAAATGASPTQMVNDSHGHRMMFIQ